MEYVLSCDQMTASDKYTQTGIGIPDSVLMERAALFAQQIVNEEIRAENSCFCFFCGRGNNGADGLALARLLYEEGKEIHVYVLSSDKEGTPLFRLQYGILENLSVKIRLIDETGTAELFDVIPSGSVLIDALTGNGFHGTLHGSAAAAASLINRLKSRRCTVFSLDMPSGTGDDFIRPDPQAVRADHTVMFGYYRFSSLLYPSASLFGKIHLNRIGMYPDPDTVDRNPFTTESVFPEQIIPERNPGGNKGSFGKILLAGGGKKAGGCVLLMTRAASAAGSGMFRALTHECNRNFLLQSFPEAIVTAYSESTADDEFSAMILECVQWSDAVAVGPGIGTDSSGHRLLAAILTCMTGPPGNGKTLVMDADALRILAVDQELRERLFSRENDLAVILTPHIGEFSSLCGTDIRTASENRFQLAEEISAKLKCTLVVKDARTLVVSPAGRFLNILGNDGMASAGTGDILCGTIAAMAGIIRISNPEARAFEAARRGVLLHAHAGDLAAEMKGRGPMTAGDLIGQMQNTVRTSEKHR